MKTVFKVMINRERKAIGGKYNIKHYDDSLAIILGFMTLIKDGYDEDNDFFRQIRIVSNNWERDDSECERVKLFVDVIESFTKGRINEDIKYTTLANTMKEERLIESLKLLDELKEFILNFELPGSMYNVGYYQAKIKAHEVGDNNA